MANNKKATVYISAEDETKKAFDSVRNGINSLAKGLEKTGLKVQDFVKGFIAIESIKSAFEAIKNSLEMSAELQNMSNQLGVSVEKLSALKYAVEQSGGDLDALGETLGTLSEKMLEASNGNTEIQNTFKMLGIQIKDTNGNFRNTEDVLLDLSDSFKNSSNNAAKVGLTLSLLQEDGKKLIPFLNQGRDGFEEMRKEAERLGLIVSSNTTAQIQNLKKELNTFSSIASNSFLNLTATAAPALTIFIKAIEELRLQLNKFDTSSLSDTQLKITEFALQAVDAFDRVSGYIITPLKAAFNTLKETASFVIDNVVLYFNNFVQSISKNTINFNSSINVMGTVLKALFELSKSVFKGMLDIVTIFAKSVLAPFELVGKAFGGIVAAMVAAVNGDFKSANKIFADTFSDMPKLVKDVGDSIGKDINNLVKNVGTGIGEFAAVIDLAIENTNNTMSEIEKNSTNLGSKIRENMKFDPNLSDSENLKKYIEKMNKTAEQNKPALQQNNSDYLIKQLQQSLNFLKQNDTATKQSLSFQQSIYDTYYSNNLINSEQFFNKKIELLNSEKEATLSNLLQQQIAIESMLKIKNGDKDIELQLKQIKSDVSKAEQDYALKSINLTQEKIKNNKQYATELLNLQSEIDAITGKKNTIDIDIKIADLREKFKFDSAALVKVDALENALKLQKQFNDELKVYESINTNLATQENDINSATATGLQTQLEASVKLRDARLSALNTLKAEYEVLKTYAQSPEEIDKLKAIEEQMKSLNLAANEMNNSLITSMRDNFATLIEDVASGTKSLKDAFGDMVKNISAQLLKLASQEAATGIMKGLFSSSSNGDSGGGISSLISSGIKSLQGADTGASMQANSPKIVGEFGKEIFIPRASGQLLNANQTRDFMNAKQQQNVIINQTINTPDSNSFKNSKAQIMSNDRVELWKYKQYI